MKKIVALFCCFCITIMSISVMGEETVSSTNDISLIKDSERKKLMLLEKLGVIENYEEIDLNAPVTRGEFADYLAALSGYQADSIDNEETTFTDVGKGKNGKNIFAVTYLGYMSEVGENLFGTNELINVNQAATALMRLAGYEEIAQVRGGYPAGYYDVALKTGVFKNVSVAADSFTRLDALLMCYNTLFVENYFDGMVIGKEKTVLENYHSVYKLEGRVTANCYTTLDGKDNSMKKNRVTVGNAEFTCSYADEYADYLGEYVVCYYRYDRSVEVNEAILIYPETEKTEIVNLQAKNIESVKGNILTYKKGERYEKLTLKYGLNFVYNNRTKLSWSIEELKIADGTLTLLDTDGDNVFDVAKALCPATKICKGIDTFEDVVFYEDGKTKTVFGDEEYFGEYYRGNKKEGYSKVGIDDLQIDDVLTIYESVDGKYLQIFATDETLKGAVTCVDEENKILEIDGAVYDFPVKADVSQITMGKVQTFYLDVYDRIVGVKGDVNTGYEYGFVLKGGRTGLENYEIMLALGNEPEIFATADKVYVDGKIYKNNEIETIGALFAGEELKKQLVRYKVNSNGEIKAIDTVENKTGDFDDDKLTININHNVNGTKTKTRYYHWHQLYDGKYMMNSKTFFLVIPTVGNEADKPELYGTNYDFADDISSYYVDIFDVNEEDMSIGAVLLYAEYSLEGARTTDGSTEIGVVTKIKYNDEGPLISLSVNNEERTYSVESTSASVSDLRFGDVVRFVTNYENKITTLYKELDIGDHGDTTPVPTQTTQGYYTFAFGRIHNILSDRLIMINNAENPQYDTAIANRYTIPASAVRTYTIVDMKTKSIAGGDLRSLSKYYNGDSEPCYIYIRSFKFATILNVIVYKF